MIRPYFIVEEDVTVVTSYRNESMDQMINRRKSTYFKEQYIS